MAASALSARSIIASTLLGTHPPRMPGRLLVALSARFGVSEGTARVALSRMVESGELSNDRGTYSLAGHLVERQQRQDHAREPKRLAWTGDWHQAVIVGPGSASLRASRRHDLSAMKLGELREGVWLRPANLERSRTASAESLGVIWGLTRPDTDPVVLAGRLWDLDGWSSEARRLVQGLGVACLAMDADDDDLLAPGFVLSAEVLRHLVSDPELPVELQPADWPSGELRQAYDSFDAAYRRLLRRFFAKHR